MAITSLKSIFSNLLNRGTNPAKSGPESENAKSFTEKQKAEAAVDRREIGLGEVPTGKIVGSVGRYHDFDGQLRLKREHASKNSMPMRKSRSSTMFRLISMLLPKLFWSGISSPQSLKSSDNLCKKRSEAFRGSPGHKQLLHLHPKLKTSNVFNYAP